MTTASTLANAVAMGFPPGFRALVIDFEREDSIEDNHLGGWYSYRASKAALNMLIKTAAIELKRSQPQAVVALHPGTVNSRLSMPFRGAEIGRAPELAAAEMLAVLAGLAGLAPGDSGQFAAYDGQRLPW